MRDNQPRAQRDRGTLRCQKNQRAPAHLLVQAACLGHVRILVLVMALATLGCKSGPKGETGDEKVRQAASGDDALAGPSALKSAGSKSEKPASGELGQDSEASRQARAPSCPTGMVLVPGGKFWVGTEREVFDREENPRFLANVAPYCLDRLEVATSEYEACEKAGKCSAPHGGRKTCNTSDNGRADHPINCIDHEQAVSVCEARGARLPTEVEWEYAARGGAEMRDYPWGSEAPDGNTCWKAPNSCVRGAHTEGAFGLHDVVGNVWEWTGSWFGDYPWEAQSGRHRVYRGGSWSRRFDKWMRPTLRNRSGPKESGSHLGVRCAMNPAGFTCAGPTSEVGACLHQVLDVMCLDGHKWNGVRCAAPGDERRCVAPAREVPGHGCVSDPVDGKVSSELSTADVTRARSPEFDGDCRENSPGRPLAYRFTGGEHAARNVVGKKLGCKNRDVGVGFNSSCCPN